MTGKMCYTMSKMLPDNKTVVAIDFNFSKMGATSERKALIVMKSRMIIGYTNMSMVGEKISEKLPNYEGKMILTAVLSLLMITIIFFYLNAMRNGLLAENALRVKEEFLLRLSKD